MAIQPKSYADFYAAGGDEEAEIRRFRSQPVVIENVGEEPAELMDEDGRPIRIEPGRKVTTTLGVAYDNMGDPWSRGPFRLHQRLVALARLRCQDAPIAAEDLQRYHQARTAGLDEIAERYLPKQRPVPQLRVKDKSTGEVLAWPWPIYHAEDPTSPPPTTVSQRLEELEAKVLSLEEAKRGAKPA